MINDQQLRMLTEEEIKKLPNLISIHPLLRLRATISDNDLQKLAYDIKDNGIKKPIIIYNGFEYFPVEEFGTEFRKTDKKELYVIEGYNRYMSAVQHLKMKHVDIPFAEFIGTEEEMLDWMKRERDIRRTEDVTARVIKAIDITIPALIEMKEKWKTHHLYEKGMKGRDDLAAKIDSVSRGNIHKGMDIQKNIPEIYFAMKRTSMTLEDAYKFLHPNKWTKVWIEKMLNDLRVDFNFWKSWTNLLRNELERIEEQPKAPKTQFQDAPVEDCKAKGKLIVQMDKIQGESNVALHKRAEGFTEALKPLANQWGITDVHVITGSIGKTLIDEALNKTFETEGALIETIALEKQQAKAIDEKELATYKKEQIAPDKKIKGKPKQYIGGKTKY